MDPDDQETCGRGSLAAVARAVEHLSVKDELGGPAAIQIDGLLASQFDEELGELGEGHAYREPGLPAIDDDQEAVALVPSKRGPRMALR